MKSAPNFKNKQRFFSSEYNFFPHKFWQGRGRSLLKVYLNNIWSRHFMFCGSSYWTHLVCKINCFRLKEYASFVHVCDQKFWWAFRGILLCTAPHWCYHPNSDLRSKFLHKSSKELTTSGSLQYVNDAVTTKNLHIKVAHLVLLLKTAWCRDDFRESLHFWSFLCKNFHRKYFWSSSIKFQH